jgi:hypothetical protein
MQQLDVAWFLQTPTHYCSFPMEHAFDLSMRIQGAEAGARPEAMLPGRRRMVSVCALGGRPPHARLRDPQRRLLAALIAGRRDDSRPPCIRS